MLERIKKDKLKFATIMVSIVIFIVGLVITIVNTGDTYAVSISDYSCSNSGYEVVSDGSKNYYCCPSGYSYYTYMGEELCGLKINNNTTEKNACSDSTGEVHQETVSGDWYCVFSLTDAILKYEISFYSNKTGDDESDWLFTNYAEYKSMYTIPSSASPSREGYKFLGWSLDKNATEAGFVVGDQVVVLENMNFYAVWSVNNYVVTYNGNGGLYEGSETYRDPQRPVYGVDYIVYDNDHFFVREGYTFTGWKDQYGNTWNSGYVNWQYDEDITLFAQWNPKNYVVTYNGNGGLYDGSETYRDPQRPVYGVDYIVYDNDHFFERDGYIFTGWKDQYGNTWNSGYVNWQYDEDITLYAQWVLNDTSGDDDEEPGIDNPDTKIEYTVDYNANGGVGTTQSSTHTYGESKKLTANGFLRTGYSFVGWATSSNGSVVYSDKEEVTNLSSTSGAIVTLYAVWDANTYKIDYKLNGGVISGNPTSGTYGEDVIIKNPTKTITIVGNDNKMDATISDNISVEQKFTGWTSSTIDTNSAYYDDTAWINGNTKVTSTVFRNLATVDGTMVTLIANWDKFDVTLPTVTKEGYNCSWNLKPDGSGDGYKSGEVVTGLTNSSTSVNLYAICESGTKTDNELDKGPQTGSAFIYIVWIIGSGALGYSVYYFMKKRSEM